MDLLGGFLAASPVAALFVCVALGYLVGKIRLGRFQLGGMPGTLFVAILIGQFGVEADPNVKTLFFALFIYALGYVSGPQFFRSLGRATLDQVHLAVFSSAVAFFAIWGAATVLGLDKGTAAGLLAGSTTESASIGTASQTLAQLGLDEAVASRLQANITVTYAVTYLFGFTLVIFFSSVIAPKLLGIDLKVAAREYEASLGDAEDSLEPGQEQAIRPIVARVYRVTNPDAIGVSVAELDRRFDPGAHVQQVFRRGRAQPLAPELTLRRGDRVSLVGRRDPIVAAGDFLGVETGQVEGLEFVGESRDVVLTAERFTGLSIREIRKLVDQDQRRGVFATRVTRAGQRIPARPGTVLQAGDVITLYGPLEGLDAVTGLLGYAVETGLETDYVYLGLGVITGMLIGMISIPLGGAQVALHTGGGCLISGLVFGWLRSKRPSFGSLPAATAVHLRDFGLAMFIASVGLEAGPEALNVLREQGLILPVLAVGVVVVVLVSSLFYARHVLKMPPVLICGALAGLLTCTPGLNAVVEKAESEVPVLGYTVPYAIANVLLTLLGPVIVLAV